MIRCDAFSRRVFLPLLAIALTCVLAARPTLLLAQEGNAPTAIPQALFDYVARPEPAFEWKKKSTLDTPLGTVHQLTLISQVWHELTWEHDLHVYVPKNSKPSATMLLWNTGGGGNERNIAFGLDMARRVGSPVAFLYGIPRQPLLGDKKEDALIAETFVRYLDTGDASWPLLFPMVKSLVKGMDALQAFSKVELKQEIKSFVVSGASKRGWTSWLTGAADPRVKGIAPLVIDTLNMRAQGPYQFKSFGAYSDQVHDYTERKLLPMPDTAEAKALWSMVDPWVYREKLKLPKMIINGANDPYWTTDALNLYWDDLKGDKWVLYVPNAGHGLEQNMPDGRKDRERALNGLAAYTRSLMSDRPLPKVNWKHSSEPGVAKLTITSTPAAKGGRLWVARGKSRDFRLVEWKEVTVVQEENQLRGEVAPTGDEVIAFYGEADFDLDGYKYNLSTQIRIIEPGELDRK